MSKIHISLSRGKAKKKGKGRGKEKSARAEFLSALMKQVSGDQGNGLTQAFKKRRSEEFNKLFDRLKKRLAAKMTKE